MTCIVGVRHGGRTYIGADSAAFAGWDLTPRADGKVFVSGEYVVGFTYSFRLGQLLQYRVDFPKPPAAQKALHRFMVSQFVEAARECLKAGGVATRDKDAEVGGTFMVGVHGRLFVVESDYQVAEPSLPFAATGSGAAYAIGSLATSTGDPVARVRKALSVAERFCGGVRGPFRVLSS